MTGFADIIVFDKTFNCGINLGVWGENQSILKAALCSVLPVVYYCRQVSERELQCAASSVACSFGHVLHNIVSRVTANSSIPDWKPVTSGVCIETNATIFINVTGNGTLLSNSVKFWRAFRQ